MSRVVDIMVGAGGHLPHRIRLRTKSNMQRCALVSCVHLMWTLGPMGHDWCELLRNSAGLSEGFLTMPTGRTTRPRRKGRRTIPYFDVTQLLTILAVAAVHRKGMTKAADSTLDLPVTCKRTGRRALGFSPINGKICRTRHIEGLYKISK